MVTEANVGGGQFHNNSRGTGANVGNRSRTEANKGGVERLMRDGYRVPVNEEDSCNSSRGTEAIWEGDRDHWRRGTVATALEKQANIGG